MSDKWEPCPRCGSNRVKATGILYFILFGLGMLSFGLILLFIPFIGIPMMVIGAGLLVAAPFSKGILECEDCKKSWRYPANSTKQSEQIS